MYGEEVLFSLFFFHACTSLISEVYGVKKERKNLYQSVLLYIF